MNRRLRTSAKAPKPDWWQRGTAIGGLVSVLLVAVGLYLTNDFNRDQYRLQQDSARQQQDLALKGQRADRFVKAIDQLGQEGNDKLGIRLGGVYALETLMRESSDDRNTIIEVLCAFIRTHAPIPRIAPEVVPLSPEDVRAAVSALGRRPDPNDHSRLDLSSTLLGLSRIDLRHANLTLAYLRGANLREADLSEANPNYADLTRADLSRANLTNADLHYAILNDAHLINANLTGVDVAQADLTGAELTDANLNFANLSEANLTRANLTNANLHYAHLTAVNLAGANLTGARLTDADLAGADLTGADLTGTDLTGADLTCTTMDASTKLPPGLARLSPDARQRPDCR